MCNLHRGLVDKNADIVWSNRAGTRPRVAARSTRPYDLLTNRFNTWTDPQPPAGRSQSGRSRSVITVEHPVDLDLAS
jgi:hypothetical protein